MSWTVSALVAICSLFNMSCGATAWVEDPAITRCEVSVQSRLVAPSTYERLDAMLLADEAAGGPAVILTFEAMNRMGVPLRQLAECKYSYRPWLHGQTGSVRKFLMEMEEERQRADPGRQPPPGRFELAGLSIDGRALSKVEMLIAGNAPMFAKLPELREDATALQPPAR